MKDDFLAVTSHELKTPLHGMVGIADSLMAGAGGALPASARTNLTLIADSGRRLTGLVDDILDYSRLKHSDVRLVRTPLDVRAITQTVLDVLEPLARRKGLALRNAVSAALPAIEADEARVYQVLYNLVGNAIKFTPEGAIRVEAEKAGELVTVSVVDGGIGIAAEKLATVFDAYAQVTPSSGPAGGVGLGLAICRKLVELHGGAMSVASEVGVGSRFSFGIPASKETPSRASAPVSSVSSVSPVSPARVASASGRAVTEAPPPSVAGPPAAAAARRDGDGVRVLVVDDEPVNLQVVANHLALEGWSVETASCGEEALAAVDTALPDVVLLDVMMPGMNGFEVCRTIREKRSASALPIVLLTSLNRREDVMHGFEVGANDYLMKPFHADELVARVRSLVLVRQSFATMEENLRLARQVADGKLSEARAKLEVDRATIEMLRYQLNPHFLLNALAAIRGAITESPETARRAVSDLSDFCRLTLRRASVEIVTVDEELEMVRAFLGVHKTRWGDYLRVSTSFDESILHSHIPAWLLQPIVENALKHGTRTSPDALEVRVVGRRRDATTLVMTVSNTGRFVAAAGEERAQGIGMANLRQRLAKWYPDGHSLLVSTEAGWVHVELTLSETTLADAEGLLLPSTGERGERGELGARSAEGLA
jgi:DNA-binding response OmpR family regulator/two-component sensor histidine kinase